MKQNPKDQSHDSGKSHGGHEDHHAHMVADFKKRFYISLAITVPVLFLSPMIQSFLGLEELGFAGDQYLCLPCPLRSFSTADGRF